MTPERFIAILAGLAIAILILPRISIWLIERWPDYVEKKKPASRKLHRASYGQPHQSERMAIAARIHALANQLESQHEQQAAQESSRASREKITMYAAIAAVFFAFWSAWIFQDQLNQMRADQRPWIKVATVEPYVRKDNMIPDGLIFGGPSFPAILGLHIVIKNVGHSPAFNVTVRVSSFLGYADKTAALADREDAVCKQESIYPETPTLSDNTNYFRAIFPDDSETDDSEGVAIGPKALAEYATVENNGIKTFQLWFFGCVKYHLPGTGEVRQTGFAYRVLHEVPSTIPGQSAVALTFTAGVNVPARKIIFEKRPMAIGLTN